MKYLNGFGEPDKITWLIQDVYIKLYEMFKSYDALLELGYTMKSFGIMQKSKIITNLENILKPDTKYVFRSTTKVATLIREATHISELSEELNEEQLDNSEWYLDRLKEGIFYDINKFDHMHYHKDLFVDLPLLNADAKYYKISENFETSFDEDFFIKPSKDRKAFNGGIIKAGTTLEDYIKGQRYQAFYIDEYAVVASLKTIYYEYRMFVVDGVVVTGSQYMKDSRVIADTNVPDEIFTFTEECHKLYQPNDIYCIDIAVTDKGLKIVEYNGWNFSGSYDCDLVKTYSHIAKFLLG